VRKRRGVFFFGADALADQCGGCQFGYDSPPGNGDIPIVIEFFSTSPASPAFELSGCTVFAGKFQEGLARCAGNSGHGAWSLDLDSGFENSGRYRQ
jgi:hypothetical protein